MKLYLTYENNGVQHTITAYGELKALRSLCSIVQSSSIIMNMSIKDDSKKSTSDVESKEKLPF